MAEMKNINGHTFVDEQARQDIEKLKTKGDPTDKQVQAGNEDVAKKLRAKIIEIFAE